MKKRENLNEVWKSSDKKIRILNESDFETPKFNFYNKRNPGNYPAQIT